MAKKRKSRATSAKAPTVIIERRPRARRRKSSGSLALVRQGTMSVVSRARRARPKARSILHGSGGPASLIGGAGIVGYLEGAGHLNFIPDLVPGLDAVGRTPTLALAAWGIGHVVKSPKIKQIGIGLAAAAAFGYGLDKGRGSKPA